MAPPADNALLEVDLLRTFVAISETGSFAAAAKRVHRTPSAVSMQMKRLEELLGQPLFEKSGRSIAVTRQGELLLGYSRRILHLNEETIARFRLPNLSGRLRFGAPDDFGTRFLPTILARFAATHPDVSVEVVLRPSIDLIQWLERDALDMALVTTNADAPAHARSRIVFTEPLHWFGRKGGVAKTRRPLPLALSSQGCVWRAGALTALDRLGASYRISYESDASQAQLAAMQADLAIAPLPASLATPELERLGPDDGLGEIGVYQLRLIEGAAMSAIGDVSPSMSPIASAMFSAAGAPGHRHQARGSTPIAASWRARRTKNRTAPAAASTRLRRVKSAEYLWFVSVSTAARHGSAPRARFVRRSIIVMPTRLKTAIPPNKSTETRSPFRNDMGDRPEREGRENRMASRGEHARPRQRSDSVASTDGERHRQWISPGRGHREQ